MDNATELSPLIRRRWLSISLRGWAVAIRRFKSRPASCSLMMRASGSPGTHRFRERYTAEKKSWTRAFGPPDGEQFQGV